jgi:hypothetical protein
MMSNSIFLVGNSAFSLVELVDCVSPDDRMLCLVRQTERNVLKTIFVN